MSDENAREFLKHLAQNQDLQERISSEVTDQEAAVAVTVRVATEAGFEVDAPGIEGALQELAAMASGGEGDELDDEQLEQVAGGFRDISDGTSNTLFSAQRFSSFRSVYQYFSGASRRGAIIRKIGG